MFEHKFANYEQDVNPYTSLKNHSVAVRLVNYPISLPQIHNSDGLADCACTSDLNPATTDIGNFIKLRFANRVEELREICRPVPEPLMVIDAPAGYGKTFLLAEVKRKYQKDHWHCVYINLKEIQGKYAIRNNITNQLGIQCEGIDNDDDYIADSALRTGMATLKKIILLFDNVESTKQNIIEWLRTDFIPHCIQMRGVKLRIIFAGRYIDAEDQFPKWSGYKRIQLTPFTQVSVQEVIADYFKQFRQKNKKFTPKDFETWAKCITHLSGGHPKSIERLVFELKESNWSLVFSQKEKEYLFKKHVAEEVEELTNSLDVIGKQALEVLSIFRLFTLSTLKILQEKGFLPPDITPLNILSILTRTGLVASFHPSPFHSDQIVRQLIITRMRIFELKLYQQLHAIAVESYNQWITKLVELDLPDVGIGPQDIVSRYVRECIYHCCQQFYGMEANQTIIAANLKQQSRALIKVLGDDPNDPGYHKKLAGIMVADEEIRASLEEQKLVVQSLLTLAFPDASPNSAFSTDLHSNYTSGIVAVEKNRDSVGTAFLVLFGEKLYAITCAHVIQNLRNSAEERITLCHFSEDIGKLEAVIRYYKAPQDIESKKWTAAQDVCVLEVCSSFPKAVSFLPLADHSNYQEKRNCWCFGYTVSRENRGRWIEKVECKGMVANGFIELLQQGQIEEGVSGSPLCSSAQGEQGEILGMIQSICGRDTAYLIPSQTILNILSSVITKGEQL